MKAANGRWADHSAEVFNMNFKYSEETWQAKICETFSEGNRSNRCIVNVNAQSFEMLSSYMLS